MPTNFAKGNLVWVKHPTEAWKPGTIGEILKNGKIRIFYSDGKDEIVQTTEKNPLLRTIPCDGDIGSAKEENDEEDTPISDDLTKMMQMITPAVLHSLRKSYEGGSFYSKLGSGTVLALNPFKDIPGLFTLNTIQFYHSTSLSELQDLPAHVYAAAQSALVTLRAAIGKVNQSIIVSGESGAGKTWTVRCLMRYLAEVGIEFKRSLSSEDMCAPSPSKGPHVTPIRASLKSSIYDARHHHEHISPKKSDNSDEMEQLDVVMVAENLSHRDNSGSVGTATNQSPSFENISSNYFNLNVNNNNSDVGNNFGAGDRPPRQTYKDESEAEASRSTDLEQFNLGSSKDSEGSDDVLVEVQEDVEDLNSSVRIVDRIERRILHSNPILEAFGNARTLRNENSSRFGKYIQLQYDRSGTIVGAQLRTYLLEKTRAVRHDQGERSYHIFYQMLHGASEQEKVDWKLPENPFPEDEKDPDGKEVLLKHFADFRETRMSMEKIGISTGTQCEIFKLLSAVLHLRQLTFEGSDDLQNPCVLEEDNPLNKTSLQNASVLLGVDQNTIMKVVTFREITAHSNRRKSVFHRPSTVEECYSRRDSFLKLIYENLFQWIVLRVGESVCAPPEKWCSFIGLLDVYGFESFENNSLEQLCINYANEKLQQHFVSNFLKEQQDEYTSEGVAWTPCDLTDNVECLLALEAPRNSLFSLLNEECRLNRARAGSQLKSRVETMFKQSKHVIQPRISTAAPSFSVVHYAGQVPYRTEDLIEKNKDEVPAEISQLLISSTNSFVNELFDGPPNEKESNDVFQTKQEESSPPQQQQQLSKGKHRPTVLTRFKKSLDDLLDTLASTDCHYIRCIKPNKQSVPDVFDALFVLNQLEACGVVETIRVCAPAHPNKMSYKEFLARYSFLLRRDNQPIDISESFSEPPDNKRRRCLTNDDLRKETCERILKKALNDNHILETSPLQFGKTKIFLSSSLFESLESSRSEEIVECAVLVQKAWREYAHRRKCRIERKALIAKREDAATVFQKAWRHRVNFRKCRAERKQMIATRKRSIAVIKNAWTSYKRRSEARIQRKILIQKRRTASIKIQSGKNGDSRRKITQTEQKGAFRGWRIRYKYKNLLDAWRQLKLLPEEDYRMMVQRRLRSLIGKEPAVSPSPSYEAIRATFEIPRITVEQPTATTSKMTSELADLTSNSTGDTTFETVTSISGMSSNSDKNRTKEKLTVYYDETNTSRTSSQDNTQDDLEPFDLPVEIHSLIRSQTPTVLHMPSSNQKRSSRTSTPSRPLTSNSSIDNSFHSSNFSPITTNGNLNGKWHSEQDIMISQPVLSNTLSRHAKLVQSSSSLNKITETSTRLQRSVSLPRLPPGLSMVHAWHYQPSVCVMTSKRPFALSSDPLALLEMQFKKSVDGLNLRNKGHDESRLKVKRRRGNTSHNQTPRLSPSHGDVRRSGSYSILKYADVPPKWDISIHS